ncbi:hypothetical protein [Parafrankia sp. FMc2]|uniref:hypothetical protein n=1 Tax=Parafrankia sp. FMc2 TaxID=3233196 RepID=UPI0034D5A97E
MTTFGLTGRLAVVTGAQRGIGRAMTPAPAAAGVDVNDISAAQQDVIALALRGDPQRTPAALECIPAGRRSSDDLPGATVFLVSNTGAHVPGAAAPANGGRLGR